MIQQAFLRNVAGYVNASIAKVVLNKQVELTEFEVKEVTDSTVLMQYMVHAADVNEVTNIELQDAQGRVITTNQVNVPIAADTLLLQTIEIKEG